MRATNVQGELIAGPGLVDPVAAEQVEIQVKYAGYVAKQQEDVQRQAAQESMPIPEDIDYDAITSLSIEVRQRLKQQKPETIGQAGRISGITPAALALLLIHLKRTQQRKKAA
jgi:tRNA uridine 5-carboxymethylaminomethyl modification enzyme